MSNNMNSVGSNGKLLDQMGQMVGSGNHPYVDTVKSNDSDKTLSGSSDSIGTAYRLDSQDSTTSVEGIFFIICHHIHAKIKFFSVT